MWKMIQNRKKQVKEFVQTEGVPIETWQQHFKELYDAEETWNINEYETCTGATVNDEEVEAKLKKLKNRKSPGTDHAPNEFLKYGGPELARKLLRADGREQTPENCSGRQPTWLKTT